jgi:hypothetical protein
MPAKKGSKSKQQPTATIEPAYDGHKHPLIELATNVTETLMQIANKNYPELYNLVKNLEKREPRIKPPNSFALNNLHTLAKELVQITKNCHVFRKSMQLIKA